MVRVSSNQNARDRASRRGSKGGRGGHPNQGNDGPQSPYFAQVINKALKLVNSTFNKSGYAVPMLLKKTNKKLSAEVSTNKWLSSVV